MPVVTLVANSPTARRWGELTAVSADDIRPERWEALAVAGQLAKPVLIGVALVLFAVTLRVSRRRAGAFALVVVMTNLTVQGAKHVPLVDHAVLGALNPLSGHVGLAAGVGLGWLLVAPRCRGVTAVAVTALLAGVGSGVVVAGWHTVPQVVCPLLVGIGWALVGASLTGPATESRGGLTGRPWIPALVSALGVGLAVAATSRFSAVVTGPSSGSTPAGALALALATVVGASIATVSLVLLATLPRDRRAVAESVSVGPAT